MVKPLSHIAKTIVLKNILMLGNCVCESVALEVPLRYESCKLVQILSCGFKLQLWHVLTKKNNLGKLGHQRFVLVVNWVCYSFVTVGGRSLA